MTTEGPKQQAQTTAIAKKPAATTATATIQDYLQSRRGLIASVAPKYLDPDKIIKVALVARSRDHKLQSCSAESLVKAVLTAAELGLEPSGLRGQGYLIPRKNGRTGQLEATFLPGYRGLVDLACRGGRVRVVEARLVRARDKFKVQLGTDPKIEHELFLGDDPGEMTHVYSVAVLDDGSRHFDQPMTRSEVERIRDRNGAKEGPWVTDFDEMAKKTAVRRHMKMLPISPEASKVVEYEESMERGDPSPLDVAGSVGAEEQPQGGAAEAKARIKATAKKPVGAVVEVQVVSEEPPPMGDDEIEAIQAEEAQS